jgi:hypothetical protein
MHKFTKGRQPGPRHLVSQLSMQLSSLLGMACTHCQVAPGTDMQYLVWVLAQTVYMHIH